MADQTGADTVEQMQALLRESRELAKRAAEVLQRMEALEARIAADARLRDVKDDQRAGNSSLS